MISLAWYFHGLTREWAVFVLVGVVGEYNEREL